MSVFMCVVLAALTIDTLSQITPGGTRVPSYDVINRSISYQYDPTRGEYVPKIGGEELIFGHKYTAAEAADLIAKGKLVIQSRACIDCHTFFGNGAYYAPDLTRAWMDPFWARYDGPKTRGTARQVPHASDSSRRQTDAQSAYSTRRGRGRGRLLEVDVGSGLQRISGPVRRRRGPASGSK